MNLERLVSDSSKRGMGEGNGLLAAMLAAKARYAQAKCFHPASKLGAGTSRTSLSHRRLIFVNCLVSFTLSIAIRMTNAA
jgi:hypothetical protein